MPKPIVGQKTVTTAGTPEKLVATNRDFNGIMIIPHPDNTGKIYIAYGELLDGSGPENLDDTNGLVTDGTPITLPAIKEDGRDQTDLIYIDSSVSGEKVSFIIY